MRCAHCDSQIPEGAAFCIECGAPIRAATDRTIDLKTLSAPPMPASAVPVSAQVPHLPAPRPVRTARPATQGNSCSGWRPFVSGPDSWGAAIFMIGLAVLFLSGHFWPWILALIGLVGAVEDLGRGKTRSAAQGLIFLGGLAVLFASGFFWPGILIIIGLAALVDRM